MNTPVYVKGNATHFLCVEMKTNIYVHEGFYSDLQTLLYSMVNMFHRKTNA